MRVKNQRGDILIGLIIAIIFAAVLGAGIYSLTTTSSFSEILDNNTDEAYQLAKAGIRMGRTTGSSGTFNMPDANHTFMITIASNGTNWVITSTGTVNTGLWQTQRLLTYAVPTAEWPINSASPSSSGGGSGSSATISGPGSGTGSSPWGQNTGTSEGTGGSSNAVGVNTTNNTISLGGGVNDSYGSIWYNGTSLNSNCDNGVCSFGSGSNLYVYFEYKNSQEDYSTTSTNSADGFTFAVISALTNSRNSTGGAPNGISMGELMGYAGPGNTTNGLGLVPPKMAIEFDTYPNGAGNLCASPSRNDANAGTTSFRDHAALIFWGASSNSAVAVEEPSGETVPGSGQCTINGTNYTDASFDDNVHGAGNIANGDPVNSVRPASPNPGSGYYEGPLQTCNVNAPNTCNWLKDGYEYSIRIEINHLTSSSFSVKAWILSWNPNCTQTYSSGSQNWSSCFSNAISSTGLTSQQLLDFQDVFVPFTDTLPQIAVNNVTIPAGSSNSNCASNMAWCTNHTCDYPYCSGAFNSVFFGFTEATGAATQQITLSNLNAFFPSGSCTASGYSISPASSSPTSTAGNYTFNVTASSGCPWVANTNVAWITFPTATPPSNSGSGSGTGSYNVSQNLCPTARTGYIGIPGQGHYLTVTQTAGSGFSSYIVTNNYGGHFSVEGGQYGSTCTRISNGSTFSVNCGDTSAVNVYSHTDDTCSAAPVATVSYASAASSDTNNNGKVQINSSYQLADN